MAAKMSFKTAVCLFGFYGILTFVGYLIFYTNEQFYYKQFRLA